MRIFVTGGSGMLGSCVVRLLQESGHEVSWSTSSDLDLLWPDEAHACIRSFRPKVVVHCAGKNGGVSWNRDFPAQTFADNTAMALNVLNASLAAGAGRVVSMLASCGYPPTAMGVCAEDMFLDDHPHPTVACHGEAKRNVLRASMFYRQQHGLDAVCLCPPTLYGPNDRTDPNRSKFPMAMAMRMVEAADSGAKEVECWGDGTPLREVMYVEDCARLVASFVSEDMRLEGDLPLNLPSGQEPTVAEFAALCAEAAGFTGRIRWKGGETAQRRKRLWSDRFRGLFPGFEPTPLAVGVKAAVDWYRKGGRR